MNTDKKKRKRILLVLPEQLLQLTGEAAETMQISRLGFIRPAIARHLALFHERDEKVIRSLFERLPRPGGVLELGGVKSDRDPPPIVQICALSRLKR